MEKVGEMRDVGEIREKEASSCQGLPRKPHWASEMALLLLGSFYFAILAGCYIHIYAAATVAICSRKQSAIQ